MKSARDFGDRVKRRRNYGSFEMRALSAALIGVERAAMFVACISMLAAMLIIVCDVVLRYGFHAPLTWVHDLIAYYLITGLFFPALAHATRNKEHIRVDLIYLHFTPQMKRLCDILINCAMAALVAYIIDLLIVRMLDEFRNDLVIAGFIEWPLWVMTALPLIGMMGFIARLIVDVLNDVSAFLHPGSPNADRMG